MNETFVHSIVIEKVRYFEDLYSQVHLETMLVIKEFVTNHWVKTHWVDWIAILHPYSASSLFNLMSL